MHPSTTTTAARLLVCLTAVGVWAQSILASVFLQGGSRSQYQAWITAHGVVADVLLGLSLAAAVTVLRLPGASRPLRATALATFGLLLLEALLGHLINGTIGGTDHDALTIVHIPLGVALLSVTTWSAARVLGPGRQRPA